jgi:hypothetical protein
MREPDPISLRIGASESTRRAARALLDKLDEDERLQRRLRLLALKAIRLVCELESLAAPKLKSMRSNDRVRIEGECRLVQRILQKISERGIR